MYLRTWLIAGFKTLFKQVLCNHEWKFHKQLVDNERSFHYGDEFHCTKCGKHKLTTLF